MSSRRYVIDAGRRWYEIWVPQDPDAWSETKLVYPDISEFPRFFVEHSGAIVNGDCYWITRKPNAAPEWLWLILAVANSSLITRYYDVAFHNKLYSGRRRFMTQYVRRFPLPDVEARIGRRIVQLARKHVERGATDRSVEAEIDALVWDAFGLVKETARKLDL